MNTLSIILLAVAVIIAGVVNTKQDTQITELRERVIMLEEKGK